MFSNERHLVTGGAGFIGSHLIDKLMRRGEEVLCVDNFYTGSKKNISEWINNKNFELIRHDVTEPLRVEVDKIWHLACPASPVHYQSNPIKTAKTSFMGTYNMFGLAKRVNARILYTSTSEVYGDPEIHPQPETYRGHVNPIGIRSCYDEGKRIGETLAFDYNRVHSTDIRVARIFNTYGPRMMANDGRVVSNFIVQALKGKSLTVYGDGSQTRSFCYVDDLVEGLSRFMESKYKGPLNLGNSDEFTILELAEKVINKINSNLKIIYKPLPQDDPLQRKPILTKAKDHLNWEPTVKLDDGLNLTIEYFKNI